MYSFVYKGFNVVAFPKAGCTQIIKLCTDTDQYKNHEHSFDSNDCAKYGTIHGCATQQRNEDPGLPYLVFYRYPHERILSFFNANCRGDEAYFKGMNLETFIDTVSDKQFRHISFDHHLAPIHKFLPKNTCRYYHLSELNKVWLNYFDIDISACNIINKTNSSSIKLNRNQFLKIQNKYISEYTFLEQHDNRKNTRWPMQSTFPVGVWQKSIQTIRGLF